MFRFLNMGISWQSAKEWTNPQISEQNPKQLAPDWGQHPVLGRLNEPGAGQVGG